MLNSETSTAKSQASRRDFLAASSAAAAAGIFAAHAANPSAVHAAGSDVLRVGLVGCGGRGSGAARDALEADKNCQLVAVGDAFVDRLAGAVDSLKKVESIASRIDVPRERQFVGFDAYQHVIDCGVDVVLLCTPPHFRPQHMEYAVKAGKHVFCEKPVAVDAKGVRRVLEASAEAKKKNLAVCSGLCWRYDYGMIDTVKKVQDGLIGDVLAVESHYLASGLWVRRREPSWSDMEWQLRNWLYFTWLSGDHNVEQHVHSLDKVAWLFGDQYPVKAIGSGGRQQRTGAEYGHIYDHHAVVYEFANGARAFSHCRQMDGCAGDVTDFVMGTKGTADLMKFTIKAGGETKRYRGEKPSMYRAEHEALFSSIRKGEPINNGDYMCKSTLMAIMGRMATYTGKEITWDMALNSQEDLSPPKYDWTTLPTPPVAVPGRTPFI